MTELALRPVSGPTEAEAWLALLGHTDALDKVRHPKELKEEMYSFLARRWDMAESKLEFADFGILWIDLHYRALTTKMASTGPGNETFSIATYRILKTSRLEGYWDTTLDNLADWIERFAAGHKSRVTVSDFERLLDTMPASHDLTVYENNLARLFWGPSGTNKGNNRTPGLLTQLPMAAYTEAFAILKTHPPDEGWEMRELMYQINHRGILCKSIMLHVGLWFNPLLEEPANRANHKHPMVDHLKPSFSKFDPTHPAYESDQSWKDGGFALQRLVLDYTLEQWPKGNLVMGKLDTIQRMSTGEYAEYLSKPFWDGLIREIRRSTDIPFRHPALQSFNTGARQPRHHPVSAWTSVPRKSAIEEQINNTIRDEDSDDTPPLSVEGDSAEGGKIQRSRRSIPRPGSSSAQLDTPETGNSSATNLRKRKASMVKEEIEDGNLFPSQSKKRKIVTLKIHGSSSLVTQALGTPSAGIYDQPDGPTQTQSTNRRSSLPLQMPEDNIPMNTIVSSARAALASMQPSPYSDPRHASSYKAAPPILASQPHEPVSWDSEENELTPLRRLRKHNDPILSNQQRPPISFGPQYESSHTSHQNVQPTAGYSHLPPSASQFDSARPSQPPPDSGPMTPQVAGSPGPPPIGKVEQAILVLQEHYGDKLQIREMLAAIKLMKNDVDATIFLTLKPGRLRNAWLQNEIKGC